MSTARETILAQIESCMAEKELVIVAIDGPCTAGKTTLARMLQDVYNCNVFHMDDFFLRPEQRTPERFAQIGGNVDYERFAEEVLTSLKVNVPFSYRPFDCHSFTLTEPVAVSPKKLTIIEGTYSQHPYFSDPYDLKIFLTVPKDVQYQRIMARPAALHDRFLRLWIPMETQYFEKFQIPQQAHIVTPCPPSK